MPPLGMAASLGLGCPRSATSSGVPGGGVSYDEDAQTYFTALDATGFTPPADYDDKKTAISDYFTNLKADSNFTPIKALYFTIWQDAGPNAINAVNPGTYNLTFSGTVTHDGGDYIYSDGSTGYASTGFHGCASSNAKFFEIGSTSAGCNAVNAPNTTNSKYAYGWYSWWAFSPRQAASSCWLYWWNGYNVPTTDGTKNGLWTTNSITPDGSDTNKAQLWRDGSSQGVTASKTGTGANASADGKPLSLMGRQHSSGTVYNYTVVQFNFWFFGTEISDMDDFNTDTATMLAAI